MLDLQRLVADLRLIAQGLKTSNWGQVIGAIGDIISMFGSTSPSIPITVENTASHAVLLMGLEDMANHFDSLATEYELLPQDALGDRLKKLMPLLIELFKKLLAGGLGGLLG